MELSSRWQQEDNQLNVTYQCRDFKRAVEMINKITVIAERHNHHPDICLHSYNNLTITLTTHDKGDVTKLDYKLAIAIDELFDNS